MRRVKEAVSLKEANRRLRDYAELGMVQEATIREALLYHREEGLPLYEAVPPDGEEPVLVRKVYGHR